MLVEKYGWAIQKSLFAETNQDSAFSQTRENSKIYNITSKYFSFFNNKPPGCWVVHITRDFLTCYSCSYYSSMVKRNKNLVKQFFGDIFPGGNFPRNNFPGGHISGWQISEGQFSWGLFSGGLFARGHFSGHQWRAIYIQKY